MALPESSSRRPLNTRTIHSESFVRDDGLIDIEGTITDMRSFPTTNAWRGTRLPDEPVHLMRVHITIDTDSVIRAIMGETLAAPYPGVCEDGVSNLQRLVGISIGPGFIQRMRELIGKTAGCTHVVTLIQSMADIAMASLASKRHLDGENIFTEENFSSLIDTCIASAADSPVLKLLNSQKAAPGPADAPTDHAKGIGRDAKTNTAVRGSRDPAK